MLLSGTNLLSYHNDPYLSGANLNETTLTQSNVNPTDFGQLFTQAVDGYVYAEPLYMSNLTIDGAQHNVVFVATQNDTVYAFDADSNQGADAAPLWVHSFTDPANGITAVPQPDVITHDIVPVIGITGTPVIDPATGHAVRRHQDQGDSERRYGAPELHSNAPCPRRHHGSRTSSRAADT